ncbi:MAG: hypothetical protein ACR2PG_09940, partial [Hyphomicrobiaceae bacterium]
MANYRGVVSALLEKHAQKARESDYDRSVAIAAISTARKVIAALPDDGTDKECAALSLSRLQDRAAHYHDPDGVYTSGKGVRGDWGGDVRGAWSKG